MHRVLVTSEVEELFCISGLMSELLKNRYDDILRFGARLLTWCHSGYLQFEFLSGNQNSSRQMMPGSGTWVVGEHEKLLNSVIRFLYLINRFFAKALFMHFKNLWILQCKII